MKKFGLITYMLAILLSIEVDGQIKEGWETWSSDDKKLSMDHPKSWIKWKLNTGEKIAFMSPKDSPDDHYPDVLVLREFPSDGKTIEDLKKDSEMNSKASNKFKAPSIEIIESNGKKLLKVVLEETKGKVVLIIYTSIKNSKVYTLVLNIEKRNLERFGPIAENSIKSFQVI